MIIKRLDKGDVIENDIVAIEVQDVSKGGVGFVCKEVLQIGAIYESYLTIWTKEVLHAFLQIVRIELKDKEFCYGATFVGMPEVDTTRIGVYQTIHEEQE